MAKYCIFCGEEINENALFCSSCGRKQIEDTPKKEEPKKPSLDIDADSAEEDLLSFLGIVPSSKKSEPKKEIKPKQVILQPEPEVHTQNITQKIEENTIDAPVENTENEETEEAFDEPILHEEFPVEGIDEPEDIQEEKEEIAQTDEPVQDYDDSPASFDINEDVQDDYIDLDKDEEPEEEPEEEPAPSPEPVTEEPPKVEENTTQQLRARRQSRRAAQTAETHIDEPKASEPTYDESSTASRRRQRQRQEPVEPVIETPSYEDSPVGGNLFDLNDVVDVNEDTEIKEDDDLQEKLRKVRASRKNQSIKISKRHFVDSMDDDDDDEFNTSLDESDNSQQNFLKQDKLTADEVATNEKRKKAIITEDDDEKLMEERSKMDGRKRPTGKNQPQKRRQSLRNIDERKIYEIEQDKSQLEENDDPNYDGYYENVLPIDHDVIKKKKIDWKMILVVIACIAGLALVFFFCLKYLGII